MRDATFRRAIWRGYRRVEVRALLERAAIQMEAHQSPSTLIGASDFQMEWGGYRRSEGDRLLEYVAGRGSDAVPRKGWRASITWRDFVVLYGVLLIVGTIFRGSWIGYVLGAVILAVFVLMIAWRRRSGIETWTFLSTIAGLAMRVRPTRQGLQRPDVAREIQRHQSARDSFSTTAHELHEALKDSHPHGSGPDTPS